MIRFFAFNFQFSGSGQQATQGAYPQCQLRQRNGYFLFSHGAPQLHHQAFDLAGLYTLEPSPYFTGRAYRYVLARKSKIFIARQGGTCCLVLLPLPQHRLLEEHSTHCFLLGSLVSDIYLKSEDELSLNDTQQPQTGLSGIYSKADRLRVALRGIDLECVDEHELVAQAELHLADLTQRDALDIGIGERALLQTDAWVVGVVGHQAFEDYPSRVTGRKSPLQLHANAWIQLCLRIDTCANTQSLHYADLLQTSASSCCKLSGMVFQCFIFK